MYLPSSEATDMDESVIITRDDLYRLSDGKIMSALLPKNSLVIDTVLGEGMVRYISLSINVTHMYVHNEVDLQKRFVSVRCHIT